MKRINLYVMPLTFSFLFFNSLSGAESEAVTPVKLDLLTVFKAAPVIYTILLFLSLFSVTLWIYSLLTLKISLMMPSEFINHIRELLAKQRFEAALVACQNEKAFCASIIASGISTRKHGPQVMMDSMQSEGKRSGSKLWQRITVLDEISIISPMLGLLGTVLGLFFAFYDTNRSAESINTIFDGLGIAIGTTVTGLIVAILSMMFYSSLKYRLVNLLSTVENEVLSLVNMVEHHPTGSTNTSKSKETAGV